MQPISTVPLAADRAGVIQQVAQMTAIANRPRFGMFPPVPRFSRFCAAYYIPTS
jgi:hypothetical protein